MCSQRNFSGGILRPYFHRILEKSEKKTVWNTQGFYNIEEKFGFRKGTLEVLFDVNINLFQICDKKHRKRKRNMSQSVILRSVNGS